jgi:membrane protein DedA with SNARE-associated domain
MHPEPQHIPAIIQSLAPVIDKYGYLAVGGLLLLEDFGIPAPGETVLIAAAFYAGLGQLNIVVVILIGILGAVLGDNIGFAIGHFGGHPLVLRFGKYVFITPERLHKTETFFNKQGGKIIIVARFIEGLRQLNGIIAGLSEMKWLKFLMYNVIGAVTWVSFWAFVGYAGGSHIETFLHYQLYVTITTLVGLALFAGHRLLKHRRKTKHQSLNATAVSATLHCLAGCSVGEVAGMIITTAYHWSAAPSVVLSIVLAFIFGYGFSMRPLLGHGISLKQALGLALAADTVSIAVMELADNGFVLAVPGAIYAGLNTGLFWISLAVSLVVAFAAAFPVNRYLIQRGKGHAVMHHHH